jgi:hypothetical protein
MHFQSQGRSMEAAKEKKSFDAWLMLVFGCTFVAAFLVVAAVLRWPIAWWIYAALLPLCLLMSVWAAWSYRRPWQGDGP